MGYSFFFTGMSIKVGKGEIRREFFKISTVLSGPLKQKVNLEGKRLGPERTQYLLP